LSNQTDQSLSIESPAAVFFKNSPFRSPSFLFVVALFVVLVTADTIVCVVYWRELSSAEVLWLLLGMTTIGAGTYMARTLNRHRRLREQFLSGAMSRISSESPLHDALQIAEQSLQDGLFYTFSTMLVFLWFFVHCLRKG
jgi:hypothetical protein